MSRTRLTVSRQAVLDRAYSAFTAGLWKSYRDDPRELAALSVAAPDYDPTFYDHVGSALCSLFTWCDGAQIKGMPFPPHPSTIKQVADALGRPVPKVPGASSTITVLRRERA